MPAPSAASTMCHMYQKSRALDVTKITPQEITYGGGGAKASLALRGLLVHI
jgi:hypothetical protein